ncbi:MAG: Crp/Fnr family transcriptional regulator [Synechococcaceae cyanobacterium]|nr:Crp/Fnr family transcriptional regulator [Synechococcaceae cyanobacterium]
MVFTPSRGAGSSDAFREVLESSYRRRSLVTLAAGSTVPLLRNNVWLVVRGMVRLGSLTIHGDELLLGLAGPSEPFGDPLSGVEVLEAHTLCDTDLLCLPCGEIREDPALSLAMLQAVTQRLRQSQALLALMGLRRVEERVRGFLELLATDYGQPCEEGLRLDLRLTHRQLACAVGTTRVTVTRVIGALRAEGWLEIDSRRRLVIRFLPRR